MLLDGYRNLKMFDQSLSKSKDLGDVLRFLPGVVVQKPTRMSLQGMADLYRIKPDLLGYFIKFINSLLLSPTLRPTTWITICLVSCKTEIVPSTIIVIPCFNIFLFAVIFCLYWMDSDPMPLSMTFSPGRFPPNLSSHFLNSYVLVLTSPLTRPITSIATYVQPPRFFLIHRTSPMTTLL